MGINVFLIVYLTQGVRGDTLYRVDPLLSKLATA